MLRSQIIDKIRRPIQFSMFFCVLTLSGEVLGGGDKEDLLEITGRMLKGGGLILDEPCLVGMADIGELAIHVKTSQSTNRKIDPVTGIPFEVELARFKFGSVYYASLNFFVVTAKVKASVEDSKQSVRESPSAELSKGAFDPDSLPSETKIGVQSADYRKWLDSLEKSLRLTSLAQVGSLAQKTLLSLLTRLPTQENPKIILGFNDPLDDGLGDHIFVYRAAAILQGAFPEAKITVLTPDEDIAKKFRTIDSKSKLQVLGLKHEIKLTDKTKIVLAAVQDCDVFVNGPCNFFEGPDVDPYLIRHKLLKSKKPIQVSVYEYDYFSDKRGILSQKDIYQAGLQSGSLGVFVNSPIKNFSESLLDQKNERLLRNQKLTELSDASLLSALTTQDPPGSNLAENHHLYYGYFRLRESNLYFVNLVIAYEGALGKRYVDIVLPGGEGLSARSIDLNLLKEYGFTSVEIISSEKSTTVLKDEEGRVLRIFLTRLKPGDAEILTMASEPLLGCTGDQSVTNVISRAGSIPVIEVRTHKKDFAKGLITLAGINPDLARHLFLYEGVSSSLSSVKAAKELLKNKDELAQNFRELQRRIFSDFSLADNYLGIVKEALLVQRDPRMAELSDAFQRSCKNPDMDRFSGKSDSCIKNTLLYIEYLFLKYPDALASVLQPSS